MAGFDLDDEVRFCQIAGPIYLGRTGPCAPGGARNPPQLLP
jgi:hypothetical protein